MGASFFQQTKQITKSIFTIITWTIFCLLILIIGFLVYYLVVTHTYGKNGASYEPKISLYTIVSPSMEPNIKVYDVIVNTKIDDAKTIKVGDVITFISTSNISKGMTVTHRVTGIYEGPEGLEFRTKGDNNLSEDTDTAKESNLLGKVVMKIPQLGRLQFFLSSKGGWLLVVIFPALYIIVRDILKISKLNKAKKNIAETEKEDEIDSSKIVLESFRKETIKNRLNEKELKKAQELKKKLKKKKKNEATQNSEEQKNNKNSDISKQEKDSVPFELPKQKDKK